MDDLASMKNTLHKHNLLTKPSQKQKITLTSIHQGYDSEMSTI